VPFAVAVLLAGAGVVAEPVLLEEIVAVVDQRPILLSELVFEARLMRGRERGPPGVEGALAPAELAEALEGVIDRLVLHAEAERLQVFELSEAEVDAGLDALRRSLGPALDRLLVREDVPEQTLRETVERELRVARYLEGRFRLAARPREPEIAAYFEAHKDEFKGRRLEQVAGEVRLRLARDKFQQLAATFVGDVRRRAKVRVLRNFEAPGSGTPMSGSAVAPEARSGG
jgi:hypothetical protein